MRKQFYKIKQFNECISLDFHWSMLAIKYNTMLIVIHIRRILESPRSIIDCDRNNPVILPCQMINTSRISFIFRAKKTFRIASGFYIPCRGNCFWIFFRFGQINGNINLTVWTVYLPLLILLYAISADIIAGRSCKKRTDRRQYCIPGSIWYQINELSDAASGPGAKRILG